VREPALRARLRERARPSYERFFAFPGFGEGFIALVEEAIATPTVAARA
jgi:hypothetical protein